MVRFSLGLLAIAIAYAFVKFYLGFWATLAIFISLALLWGMAGVVTRSEPWQRGRERGRAKHRARNS